MSGTPPAKEKLNGSLKDIVRHTKERKMLIFRLVCGRLIDPSQINWKNVKYAL
jgi:hypothetical protein